MHFLLISFLILHVEARRYKNYKHKEPVNPDLKLPNILPETYQYPVRVDRVNVRGYGDIDFKEPFDILEHHLDIIKDPHREAQKTLVRDGQRIKWKRKKENPAAFLSPRDEMMYYKKNAIINNSANYAKMYDFTHLLESNLAKEVVDAPATTKNLKKKTNEVITHKTPRVNVSSLFEDNSFYLKSNEVKVKWTSCDEFARGALFHPDDIVNTQWLPFYIWSIRNFVGAKIHRFAYPTKKVVQYYKTIYGPYVGKLDWKQPKLLLKEAREMLLIAGDRKGLFYGVPRHELSDAVRKNNLTLPLIKLRLKIQNPYLALMYCEENYAIIMAELGTEPATDTEKTAEAATLKFTGMGKPVSRNIEEEMFLRELEMKRRQEAEPKKYIDVFKGVPTNQ
ncbi:uncharacterized protein LOC121728217 [Aricia agestis]|uniref:uncharacterized protein LOC121728217 n=1 Tax=Aricia agestis TaxID=91739 RepID=UPI001C20261D|nr:uncharacterized protein LOC121728217 [Aricia agestis]